MSIYQHFFELSRDYITQNNIHQFLNQDTINSTSTENGDYIQDSIQTTLVNPNQIQHIDRNNRYIQVTNKNKRDNNTVLKIIFTWFKGIVRSEIKKRGVKKFKGIETLLENQPNTKNIEKIFSYFEFNSSLSFSDFTISLNQQFNYQQILLKSDRYLKKRPQRKIQLNKYLYRFYDAINNGMNYKDRLNRLYSNRKHESALEEIEQFRLTLQTQNH